MISNNEIKYLKSLNLKKYRLKYQHILIEGLRLVIEGLNANNNYKILNIYIASDYIKKPSFQPLIKKADDLSIKIIEISNKELQQITQTKNPQGVCAQIKIEYNDFKKIKNNINGNVIILDEIKDPGNLGTLLRTIAWFGINNVFLSNKSVDIFNDKVLRSGMGGHFKIKNLVYDELEIIIAHIKNLNYKIYSADLDGKDIFTINKPPNNWALILGSESFGMNKRLDNLIDSKISITGTNNIDSLNVAVAGSISIFHLINHK